MAATDSPRNTNNRGGWRRLGVFWLSVVSLTAIGGGVLQWLGPPEGEARVVSAPVPAYRAAPVEDASIVVMARPELVPPPAAGRDTPGPVADADPALLEPVGDGSKDSLPRIASDGRTSMQVYAAGFDHSSRRPRVGLLLAGIGANEAESDAAIRALPGAVSLAISPYAAVSGGAVSGGNLTRLLATARTTGHEYLLAVPLEPAGFPLNDPGPSTLLTGASIAANQQNLHWIMSRIDGYVGAAGVIGTMRGERLAAMTDQMDAVLSDLAGRGLLYIDPREPHGPVAKTWGRHVDFVVDDPADRDVADRAMIDAKLAELEQQAKDNGSALGLVMRPTPVTVARVAAWCNGLADRGLALAPVSALALPPANGAVKLSERDQ
jgi:polysaccharide deacetylase 2 family uncharacterized protein YibQ